MKKFISLLLVALTVLTMFAACKKNDDKGSDTSDGNTVTTAPNSGEKDRWGRDMIYSPLPDDLDFEGKTVTFLVRDDSKSKAQYEATDESSDKINEAVVARNKKVEQELNVNIEFLYCPQGVGNTEFHNRIIKSSAAGDKEFDVVSTFAYYSAAMVYQGYFHNLLGVENLHLDQPYWNQSYIEEAQIYDQLYMTVGDLSLSSLQNTFCMFFNKKEFNNYFPDVNLYDVVRNGEWTMEYFHSLIKDISFKDLNANNAFDEKDYYGLMTTFHSFSVDAFYAAHNLKLCKRDDAGIPKLTLNTPETISAYEATKKLLHKTRGVYVANSTDIVTAREGFIQNRSVFSVDMMGTGAYYAQNMVEEFGVLPMFKGSKEQEKYTTTAQDSYDALAIMNTVDEDKIPAIGATLDLMCYESYMEVRPEYFETVTKIMYSSGDDDAEMYDTVIENTYYDYGMINSYAISRPNIGHFWRMVLNDENISFTSSYKVDEPIFVEGLKAYVKYFEDMQ